MGQAVETTMWQGLPALRLENERLRVLVVPEVGAKIVSLFDKDHELEWLVGPGPRPLGPVTYGAVFTEQDMSGWDEMFPTISACVYPAKGIFHGAQLPDHGEVWALAWTVVDGPAGGMTLAVNGRALPYRLSRSLDFVAPDTLKLDYVLTNDGQESLAYLWAAHPQFACGDGLQIVLPAHVEQVTNSLPAEWGWGEPGSVHGWPQATNAQGQPARLDLVGPPTLQRARKLFVRPELAIGEVTLRRRPMGAWLRLAWSPVELPYFGLWVDEEAISHTSAVAPEPMTGYYDSLAIAWDNGRVTTLAPGATQFWTMTVQVGSQSLPA